MPARGGGTVSYLVGSDSPAPTDTLDLSITDNGATGAGGAQWGFDSVTMNLVAVNDAPIITIPGLVSTPEDTPLVFSTGGGNLISITDVDAAGFPVQVTLNVSNGVVTLAGTAGPRFHDRRRHRRREHDLHRHGGEHQRRARRAVVRADCGLQRVGVPVASA